MRQFSRFRQHYSDSKLRATLGQLAQQGGDYLLRHVRLVWALATDPATPKSVRLVLLGVLGYVILTFDVVPDCLPGVGWSDDLAAVLAGLSHARPNLPVTSAPDPQEPQTF